MVSSIDNTNDKEYFCETEGCFYYVTLVVNNIDSVAFFVTTQSFFITHDFMHSLQYENVLVKSEVISLNLNV